MPEGIGYSGVAAKSDAARPQQTVVRAERDSVTQASNQRPPELEPRKKNPAVEVKLSNEATKAEGGTQPRQDVNTYEALNRKS